MSSKINRRRFLGQATSAIAVPTIISASALGHAGKASPSARITIGVIGLGSRGFNLIDSFLGQPDAEIVAICDVDSFHYRDRPWGKGTAFGREPAQKKIEKAQAGRKTGLDVYSDFREVTSREDIDAIVVATPDHWHALCTLEALRNDKDVYCEKPITHTFHEGQLVYREAKRRGAVFQTGSQQRSDSLFRRAVELVHNGHIGKVQRVEVGLPPGYDRPQGNADLQQPPDHLDYNFWTGPAPLMAYMRARNHRWWRGHRAYGAYGGGVLMDWIGHHNDIAHWALGMDNLGPASVEAVGWKFPETKVYNTPQHYEIRCEYTGGVISTISSKHQVGTKIIGEDGWIYVNRGQLRASDPRLTKPDFKVGEKKVNKSPGHTRNFLDCVKSRDQCIAPAETAHRSITPGHLAYVSHELGRKLRWDAKTEQVINDDEANKLLHENDYRTPWALDA